MVKRKFLYDTDTDLLQCDCSCCENIRSSYEDRPVRRELSCRDRLVNFLRRIIFR